MELATLRDGLQVEFTGEFMFKSQVAHMDVGIDRGSVGSAGTFEDEIGAAFHGETTGIELAHVGEFEVVAGQVEMECSRRRVIGGASRDGRGGIDQMETIAGY